MRRGIRLRFVILLLAVAGMLFYIAVTTVLNRRVGGEIIQINEKIFIRRKSQEVVEDNTIHGVDRLHHLDITSSTSNRNTEYPPIRDEYFTFLQACASVVKLVVIDPKLLLDIEARKDHVKTRDKQTPSYIRLTLGIFEDQLDEFEKCTALAKKSKFYVRIKLAKDHRVGQTKLGQSHNIIQVQYIFYTESNISKGTVIQIVVLFNRQHFIWVPGIHITEEFAHSLEGSLFGEFARSFDRFNITQTSLAGHRVFTPSDVIFYLWQFNTSQFVECNATIVDLFNAKYNKYNNLTLKEDTTQMRNIMTGMLEVRRKMNGLHKTLFLAAGTLLGWARQCGIIAYTLDADTGAFASEYDVEVTKAFLGNRVASLRMRLGRPSDSLELRLLAGPVAIDIFMVYETMDSFWMGGHFFWQGNYTRYKIIYPKFKICSCNFIGHRFNLPCDYNKILTSEYGKNWYVPKTFWGINDPPNFKWNGIWVEDDLPKVHQIFED